MMWMQDDAAGLLRRRLRKVCPPGLIQAQVPQKWTRDKPPVVTVVSDGTPVSDRARTSEIVRVTVHAKDKPTAFNLMREIDAFLVSPMTVIVGATVRPGVGIFTINDSKVGGAISSATYSVAMSRKVFRNGI